MKNKTKQNKTTYPPHPAKKKKKRKKKWDFVLKGTLFSLLVRRISRLIKSNCATCYFQDFDFHENERAGKSTMSHFGKLAKAATQNLHFPPTIYLARSYCIQVELGDDLSVE